MKTVLCIEPDKALAKTYVQALTYAGFKTHVAATAEEAIMLADEQHPDLVVMEMQLTGHNGMAFLHEFRSYDDWRDVPVVINTHLSAVDMQQIAQILKDDLGVASILYKPRTSLSRLIGVVREQVQT